MDLGNVGSIFGVLAILGPNCEFWAWIWAWIHKILGLFGGFWPILGVLNLDRVILGLFRFFCHFLVKSQMDGVPVVKIVLQEYASCRQND